MTHSRMRCTLAMTIVVLLVGSGCATVEPLDPAGPDAGTPPDADAGVPADAASDASQVIPPAAVPTRYPSDRSKSPITTFVAEGLRGIRAADMALDDQVFMKVGDSSTVSSRFLHCFAGEPGSAFTIDLGGRNDLEATLSHFRSGDAGGVGPFERDSLAARVGAGAGWPMSGTPSPLEQELEAIAPRFSLVSFGTNDMQLGSTHASALGPFHENLSALVDELIAAGNIVIITGLPPRGDTQAAMQWAPTYNAVTRAVAESLQLPYIDLYLASAALPDQGLGSDGIHGNAYIEGGTVQPCIFSAQGRQFHYNVRNLLTAEVLDAVRRVVLSGEDAPDDTVAPVTGAGAPSDAFIIDSLPFTHTADTTASTHSDLGDYPACDGNQDESGSEYTYRLKLSKPTAIRLAVLDRGDTDIDLHLLDAKTAACLQRADTVLSTTLAPGIYDVVLDTFVPPGEAPRAGSYQFVAIECDDGDPTCL